MSMQNHEETDILLELNNHKNKLKSLEHRMDNQEKECKTLNDLALSVKELAINMKIMSERQSRYDDRLHRLEEKPIKRWETIVQIVLTTLIGAMIGFILSRIGL